MTKSAQPGPAAGDQRRGRISAASPNDLDDWTDQPVADIARYCLRGGVSVVPIKTDGSKQPTVPWKELQIECLPEEIVDELFDGDAVGIAAVCGKVSGNLEIIDFDAPGLFEKWQNDVDERAPGLIDRLYHATTPRRGEHIGYRCSAIEGNQKLAQVPDKDEEGRPKPKVTIETRGEGGYALLPGSPPECHPSGRRYRHVGGPPITDAPMITPQERLILLECARAHNQWIERGRTVQGDDGPTARRRDEGHPQGRPDRDGGDRRCDRPGDDFNVRADWQEDVLGPHGWSAERRGGGVTYWKRPGKAAPGSSATTGHCKTPDGDDLLYVFSDNAHPFEALKGYTKFSAYALLFHDGDFKAAARDLAKKGFGTPKSSEAAANEMSVREANEIVTDLLVADDITPGDPFRPRVLSALATLKKERRAIFENVREELKKGGVRVGELDKLLEPSRSTDADLSRPLTALLEALAQDGKGLKSTLGHLQQMSNLVIDWLVDHGGRFAYHDDRVYLFWHGKPHLIDDSNLEFDALMRDLAGLNIRTYEAKVVWQDLRCHGRTHGVPARTTVWTSTDVSTGVTHLACTPSKLVVIENGSVKVHNNGENRVFLRYPALMEPFKFDASVQVADAIELLDEVVVQRLPLPRESALVLTATVLATILRDYCRTRPITHITGKSNAGKSTAARLLGILLYGVDVVGIHTLASLYEDGSRNPLQILDNKETRNLTVQDIDFLLTSATGITRFKHSRTSDNEVLRQRVDSLVMLTSIEPLPTPELQSRLWRFDVDALHGQKNFDDLTAEQDIRDNRATMLSGIIKMLGEDVLNHVVDGRMQELKKGLIKAGIIDKDDRTRDFATLVAAILAPICDVTGEKLTAVLRGWMVQRTAASSRAAVGTNDFVYWLGVLAHLDRTDSSICLPFAITEKDGVVSFRATSRQLLMAFRVAARWVGGRPPWANEEALGRRLANDRKILGDAGWTWIERKDRVREFTWDAGAEADPRSDVSRQWRAKTRGDR